MTKKSTARKNHAAGKKKLNLALQGGGAHGAFTWGVLDRLLEEDDIHIQAISGTSAGAMNAAVLIDGMEEGGRDRAKAQLAEFWGQISGISKLLGPWLQAPFQGNWQQMIGYESNLTQSWLDTLTRTFSPYELNPLNINPLREVLEGMINFDRLRASDCVEIFVTATNVETGHPRLFERSEVTSDVLLASGCLPFVYQAIEIEGVPYWDGGYVGNPSIWPLYYKTPCGDVMLIQINPLMRAGTPRHAADIVNRLNEITFNTSLVAEMRAIQFVRDLIDEGKLNEKDYRRVNVHMVEPPPELQALNASSKMNANWEFFVFLKEIGRTEMDKWLKKHKKMIGVNSTMDITKTFLTKPHHAPRVPEKTAKEKPHA